MPVKSAPYFFAKCDNCGKRADYGEFTAFEDPGSAADVAVSVLEWTQDGEKLHCPDCPALDVGETAGDGDG